MSPWVWVVAAYGCAALLVGGYAWRVWCRYRQVSRVRRGEADR